MDPYQQYQLAMIIGVIVQNVIPLLLFVLFLLLLIKAGATMLAVLSSNEAHARYLRRLEQRHRHRLENLVLWAAFGCLAAGGLLALNGYGYGSMDLELPGGFRVENVGTGVVIMGFGLMLVWSLLRLERAFEREGQPGASSPRPHPHGQTADAGWSEAREAEVGPRTGSEAVQPSSWLGEMTLPKASLITVAALLFLGPFGIPVGGYFVWQALKGEHGTRLGD